MPKKAKRKWGHQQWGSINNVVGCPLCDADRGELCMRTGRTDGKKRIAIDVHKGRAVRARIIRMIHRSLND
jgi:hypothetical protein